ncbi:hypothetical protein E2C01_027737 [Portunus trituberculatus]|uniref:Secreted protein n=1 Tax=Portunus trituberculatus TaxID=210409 RepID=A0A5B7EJG7_PORTR|nr:hypothetical protein [Portunus trituberculatus]
MAWSCLVIVLVCVSSRLIRGLGRAETREGREGSEGRAWLAEGSRGGRKGGREGVLKCCVAFIYLDVCTWKSRPTNQPVTYLAGVEVEVEGTVQGHLSPAAWGCWLGIS